MMNPKTILPGDVYAAIVDAGSEGLSMDALCERFGTKRSVMSNRLSRINQYNPGCIIRPGSGRVGNVTAACFHGSQKSRIQTAPVRRLGIVVGGLDHQILLALRPPGGMTTEQIHARFSNSPNCAISRLRSAGLVDTKKLDRAKQITLTAKGRELVDPDGPLARARTLINYL